MPIEFWIVEELDLCYAKWSGSISAREALENFQNYLGHPHYRTGRAELVDLRQIEDLPFDIVSMSALLEIVNSQAFPDITGTRTVVLADTDFTYGRARQYQTLASMQNGIDIHIATSEEEALALLGRSERTIGDLLDRHIGLTALTG